MPVDAVQPPCITGIVHRDEVKGGAVDTAGHGGSSTMAGHFSGQETAMREIHLGDLVFEAGKDEPGALRKIIECATVEHAIIGFDTKQEWQWHAEVELKLENGVRCTAKVAGFERRAAAKAFMLAAGVPESAIERPDGRAMVSYTKAWDGQSLIDLKPDDALGAMRAGLPYCLTVLDMTVAQANGYLDGIEGKPFNGRAWGQLRADSPQTETFQGYDTGYGIGRRHLERFVSDVRKELVEAGVLKPDGGFADDANTVLAKFGLKL